MNPSDQAPLVSVVVVNYNGLEFTGKCLESLRSQTHPAVETIVVDNASGDGSADLVREQFPGVKLVVNRQNVGFAAGNNVGIREARGGYVALLNNDAEADPAWLEELVRVAEAEPRVGMCASKVLFTRQREVLNSTGLLIYRDLTAVNRGMGERDVGQYDRVEETFGPYGAAAFYRKKMLDEIGLFDETYFMFREEDDLAWRARLAGWVCYYVPRARVYHYRSLSSGVGSPLKLYYGERNRIWNALKVLSPGGFLATLPATLCRYAYTAGILWGGAQSGKVRQPSSPSATVIVSTLARAWLDGARGVPRIMRRKKAYVPPGYKTSVRSIRREFEATLKELARLHMV
jgi:GT2 family glycosyltransferase